MESVNFVPTGKWVSAHTSAYESVQWQLVSIFQNWYQIYGKSRIESQIHSKGHVKLMQRVKIAHSFLHFVSNLFHFMILRLSMWFHIWLSKNFSKPTSKKGEISRFNRSLLIESF